MSNSHPPRPGILPAAARVLAPTPRPEPEADWWRKAWALLSAYLDETEQP